MNQLEIIHTKYLYTEKIHF